MPEQVSYVKEAIKEPLNIWAMVLFVALAVFAVTAAPDFALLRWLAWWGPLLAGGAAEALYLTSVPNTPGYRRRVDLRIRHNSQNESPLDFPTEPVKVQSPRKVMLGVIGALVGGFLGFLLRPSAPLIGQLDFGTVLTRGTNLRGLDSILVSTAEMSFNYLLVGIILGGVGGVLASYFVSKKKESPDIASAAKTHTKSAGPKNIRLGQTPEQIEAVLGQPEKIVSLGPKVMHVYPDIKVIFSDGKVSDVQ